MGRDIWMAHRRNISLQASSNRITLRFDRTCNIRKGKYWRKSTAGICNSSPQAPLSWNVWMHLLLQHTWIRRLNYLLGMSASFPRLLKGWSWSEIVFFVKPTWSRNGRWAKTGKFFAHFTDMKRSRADVSLKLSDDLVVYVSLPQPNEELSFSASFVVTSTLSSSWHCKKQKQVDAEINKITNISIPIIYSCFFPINLPSSCSSLVYVSAVSKLTIKRCVFGLVQGWTDAEMVGDNVTRGLNLTDEYRLEVVRSCVVARTSFLVSGFMESRLTCAVFLGCRSFCTAAKGQMENISF